MFFYHLPKEEKMKITNDISKHRNYETTMDYLEEILNEVNKRTRCSNTESRIALSDLIKSLNVSTQRVNMKQSNKVLSLMQEYKTKTNGIWLNETMTSNEKFTLAEKERVKYLESLASIRMNYATLRYVILETPTSIQRRTLSLLYNIYKEEFVKLFKINLDNISYVKRDEEGDIYIYGKRFSSHVRSIKDVFTTIED